MDEKTGFNPNFAVYLQAKPFPSLSSQFLSSAVIRGVRTATISIPHHHNKNKTFFILQAKKSRSWSLRPNSASRDLALKKNSCLWPLFQQLVFSNLRRQTLTGSGLMPPQVCTQMVQHEGGIPMDRSQEGRSGWPTS